MPLSQQILVVALKCLSVTFCLTGCRTVLLGIATLTDKPAFSATTALTDSQLRYHAAGFVGCGIICWWASDSLSERHIPFAILCGVVMMGGIGRALSAWQYGFGAPWTRRAIWVELLVPIGLWGLWMLGP